MNNELFLKNTQALFEVDQPLAYALRILKNIENYNIDKNSDGLNIINKQMQKIYENPNQELLDQLVYFQTHYKKYPVLFFYGFGNGMLYKTLCENKNHKHII
ncbi:TPA: motility associated factor glycosyltransferase family protein, partial [Campylobacter jejuni]|nr:motility associated factor glycosyltransferase family protein [Campylobacter jejuni]